MALGQSIRSAIGTAWRGVLSAVNQGISGVETVGRAVASIGREASPPGLLDTTVVDQLASMAGGWVNAREAVSAAGDGDQVDASMVTLAPWSMDLNAFNAQPSYHVILGINVAGLEGVQYRTITGITDLPATVGELRSAMTVNAVALSVGTTPGGGVGGEVESLDSITITVGPALG